jgi:CheY-like chemotaxis protein
MRPTKPVEVLLVEDNAGDIRLVKQALAAERYPVSIRIAVDGKQAVDMLSEKRFDPDLVILDLSLPKIDGLSVLERSHPHVPVVVFSSSTKPAEIKRSFELGVRDFIPKPLDPDGYSRVVSYIVQRWGAEETELAERTRIDRALEALRGTNRRKPNATDAGSRARRSGISVSARKAQSERMKRYWAARRKKSAAKKG